MGADDRDARHVLVERKQAQIVLQQNDSFFRVFLGSGPVCFDGETLLFRREIKQPFRKHAPQDAMHHVVQARRLNRPVRQRLLQQCPEIILGVEPGGQLLIQPCIGRFDGAVNRAPIRQHPAGYFQSVFSTFVSKNGSSQA